MGAAISATADIFGMGPASKQADATTEAARTSANAQLQAAQIAADAARFRPVGITNTFGTSSFGTDAAGNVNSANYTLSPQLQGYQNFLAGQGGIAQGDVQGLLNLGRGYLGESPDAVRQRYIGQQNALLAPQNEQTLAGIRNNLFNTGRSGLATGATSAGNMAATNPEMAAYYNALAKQQAGLAAGAEQAAQQQVTFGQGLLNSAYDPFKAGLAAQQGVEGLGQGVLDMGTNLGKIAMSGAQSGNNYLTQQVDPTNTSVSGLLSNPNFTAGVSGLFGSSGQNPDWYNNGGYSSWSAGQNNAFDVGNMS